MDADSAITFTMVALPLLSPVKQLIIMVSSQRLPLSTWTSHNRQRAIEAAKDDSVIKAIRRLNTAIGKTLHLTWWHGVKVTNTSVPTLTLINRRHSYGIRITSRIQVRASRTKVCTSSLKMTPYSRLLSKRSTSTQTLPSSINRVKQSGQTSRHKTTR